MDTRDIIENDESTCAKLFSFIIISSIIWLGYETFNWPSHIEPSVERETAMKTVKKQETVYLYPHGSGKHLDDPVVLLPLSSKLMVFFTSYSVRVFI